MRDKISRQNIAKLPNSPKSKSKQMMWDTAIPCFGCYKSTKGRVSFIYQYRMPGDPDRTIRSTLLGYMGEITPEQARALAAELALKRRTGVDPVLDRMEAAAEEAAKTDLVLANYVEGYLERRIAKGKPHNATQTAIIRRDVVGLLGDKRIDRLTRPEVEEFAAKLYARAPSAKRAGRLARRLYSVATTGDQGGGRIAPPAFNSARVRSCSRFNLASLVITPLKKVP